MRESEKKMEPVLMTTEQELANVYLGYDIKFVDPDIVKPVSDLKEYRYSTN